MWSKMGPIYHDGANYFIYCGQKTVTVEYQRIAANNDAQASGCQSGQCVDNSVVAAVGAGDADDGKRNARDNGTNRGNEVV